MNYELREHAPIETSSVMPPGEWVYDPSTGVYLNPTLTATLLTRYGVILAERPLGRAREYGKSVVLPFVNHMECANLVAPLLIEIAAAMPVVFYTLDLRMTIAEPIFTRRPPMVAFYGTGNPR